MHETYNLFLLLFLSLLARLPSHGDETFGFGLLEQVEA